MLVGVPKEIKTLEFRVGLTTGSVEELVHHGHQVIVEVVHLAVPPPVNLLHLLHLLHLLRFEKFISDHL